MGRYSPWPGFGHTWEVTECSFPYLLGALLSIFIYISTCTCSFDLWNFFWNMKRRNFSLWDLCDLQMSFIPWDLLRHVISWVSIQDVRFFKFWALLSLVTASKKLILTFFFLPFAVELSCVWLGQGFCLKCWYPVREGHLFTFFYVKFKTTWRKVVNTHIYFCPLFAKNPGELLEYTAEGRKPLGSSDYAGSL